mmetsp:Transcript_53451/g.148097  ORF Transcript_53451/g.148097 Transcript_53451/m.148097 type:complete len:315 (+) Transcript_53451:431-1375(+)
MHGTWRVDGAGCIDCAKRSSVLGAAPAVRRPRCGHRTRGLADGLGKGRDDVQQPSDLVRLADDVHPVVRGLELYARAGVVGLPPDQRALALRDGVLLLPQLPLQPLAELLNSALKLTLYSHEPFHLLGDLLRVPGPRAAGASVAAGPGADLHLARRSARGCRHGGWHGRRVEGPRRPLALPHRQRPLRQGRACVAPDAADLQPLGAVQIILVADPLDVLHVALFVVEADHADRSERPLLRLLQGCWRYSIAEGHADAEAPKVDRVAEDAVPLVFLAETKELRLQSVDLLLAGVLEFVHHVVTDPRSTVLVHNYV